MHTRGMIAAFYHRGHLQVTLHDGTVKTCTAGHVVFVPGDTLEAMTTFNAASKDPGMLLWGARQHVKCNRVSLSERGDAPVFAYELLAHPLGLLNPAEYGRSSLGKATPPLFREAFSVRDFYTRTPAGRRAAERVMQLESFGEAKAMAAEWLLAAGGVNPEEAGPNSKEPQASRRRGAKSSSTDEAGHWEARVQLQPKQAASTSGGSSSKRHSAADACSSQPSRPSQAASFECLGGLDVALMIMRKLDTVSLCRAAMVCRVWRMACYSPRCLPLPSSPFAPALRATRLAPAMFPPPCRPPALLLPPADRLRRLDAGEPLTSQAARASSRTARCSRCTAGYYAPHATPSL